MTEYISGQYIICNGGKIIIEMIRFSPQWVASRIHEACVLWTLICDSLYRNDQCEHKRASKYAIDTASTGARDSAFIHAPTQPVKLIDHSHNVIQIPLHGHSEENALIFVVQKETYAAGTGCPTKYIKIIVTLPTYRGLINTEFSKHFLLWAKWMKLISKTFSHSDRMLVSAYSLLFIILFSWAARL